VQAFQGVQKYVSTRLLATRQGTIMLGLGAAGLAALVLLVYLNQYRSSVSAGASTVSVLVARSVIEQGTPGDAIGTREMFQAASIARDEVKEGAITDPAALRGTAAATDILPGEQLTVANLTPSVSTLGTQLADAERAVSIPVVAHGLVGHIQGGDHVDVLGIFSGGSAGADGGPFMRTLLQNIVVITPPGAAAGGVGEPGGGSTVVLRVNPQQAARLALAAENASIWLVLRPRAGAKASVPPLLTLESIVQGRP
jgi:Flp pilus assembly protein CpaB